MSNEDGNINIWEEHQYDFNEDSNFEIAEEGKFLNVRDFFHQEIIRKFVSSEKETNFNYVDKN